MQIDVADLVHADGVAGRARGGGDGSVVRRGDDDVVAAVDAGVGQAGREHRLEQHKEAAAVVAGDRLVEVDVGGEDHLRHRIMNARGEGLVLGAVLEPDVVQVDVRSEGAYQRQHVDHAGGLGREVKLADVGGELRRRREIERQRDVLADVQTEVILAVLGDVLAERIAAGAGGLRGGEGLVDIGADLGADRRGLVQIGVVAAGVERGSDLKERLADLEGDRGAALLNLRGARARDRVGLVCLSALR